MRLVFLAFVVVLLFILMTNLVKEYLKEKYGVWKPINSKEDPYLEVHRFNGKMRRNERLELADKLWAVKAESDPAIAEWWKQRRVIHSRETRRS